MFVITSMPVGGAETLLSNMLYRFDRRRIVPLVCCLKDKDVLGEKIAQDFPVFSNILHHKLDVSVIGRLKAIIKQHAVDAVVTIGAGDKMFWGRLAARYARVPVVLSALHSTGWPDGVGTLNRLLTKITHGFIAVAPSHGQFLIRHLGFPENKVFVIPNGVDTNRFQFDALARRRWRSELGIPESSPVVGILAALRPEKNHTLFVQAAAKVHQSLPSTHFLIVGDGPERANIERAVAELNLQSVVHLVGCTQDVPGILSAMDLFALTSHNEASPVSILEAMSCQRPVVAPDVGSIRESVLETTGFLVSPGSLEETVSRWLQALNDPQQAASFGSAARRHVLETGSLETMTEGYSQLIESLYQRSILSAKFRPFLQPSLTYLTTAWMRSESEPKRR